MKDAKKRNKFHIRKFQFGGFLPDWLQNAKNQWSSVMSDPYGEDSQNYLNNLLGQNKYLSEGNLRDGQTKGRVDPNNYIDQYINENYNPEFENNFGNRPKVQKFLENNFPKKYEAWKEKNNAYTLDEVTADAQQSYKDTYRTQVTENLAETGVGIVQLLQSQERYDAKPKTKFNLDFSSNTGRKYYQLGGNTQTVGNIPVSPAGQFEFPNQPVLIPSGDITMRGMMNPILAVPNNDQPTLMMPNMNYNFRNSNSVLEIPVMANGGRTYTREELDAMGAVKIADGTQLDLSSIKQTQLARGLRETEDLIQQKQNVKLDTMADNQFADNDNILADLIDESIVDEETRRKISRVPKFSPLKDNTMPRDNTRVVIPERPLLSKEEITKSYEVSPETLQELKSQNKFFLPSSAQLNNNSQSNKPEGVVIDKAEFEKLLNTDLLKNNSVPKDNTSVDSVTKISDLKSLLEEADSQRKQLSAETIDQVKNMPFISKLTQQDGTRVNKSPESNNILDNSSTKKKNIEISPDELKQIEQITMQQDNTKSQVNSILTDPLDESKKIKITADDLRGPEQIPMQQDGTRVNPVPQYDVKPEDHLMTGKQNQYKPKTEIKPAPNSNNPSRESIKDQTTLGKVEKQKQSEWVTVGPDTLPTRNNKTFKSPVTRELATKAKPYMEDQGLVVTDTNDSKIHKSSAQKSGKSMDVAFEDRNYTPKRIAGAINEGKKKGLRMVYETKSEAERDRIIKEYPELRDSVKVIPYITAPHFSMYY